MRRSWQPSVNSADVFKRIWSQGKDVNREDEEKSTALHKAAEAGSRVFVWMLLKKEANVNAQDCHGRTALHLACESYHNTSQRIAQMLLEYGAEVNVENELGETPLHVACWVRNRQLVEILLKSGADQSLADRNGLTPLHVTAHFQHGETSMAGLLLKYPCETNVVDSAGRTPLHWACFFEGMWTVHAILNKDADVNLVDSHGDTALHLACVNKGREIVAMLIGKGARHYIKNLKGRTALHEAALHGANNVIIVLADIGADVNARDNLGETPLHLAVSWITKTLSFKNNDLAEVIETLLNKGAKVDVENSSHKTPFEEMVQFKERFCSRDFETSNDKEKVTKLSDLFIEHVIKLKTAKLEVTIDVTSQLGSVRYDILQIMCGQEILTIKSILVVNGLSLYHVFSNADKPYILSKDDILTFEEFLRSSDLLKKLPLYVHLLRNTFYRSKLLTTGVQTSEDKNYDDLSSEPCDGKVLKEEDKDYDEVPCGESELKKEDEDYDKVPYDESLLKKEDEDYDEVPCDESLSKEKDFGSELGWEGKTPTASTLDQWDECEEAQ